MSENNELPNGWVYSTVGDLCQIAVGFAFKSDKFVGDGIRLLRGENIEPGALRWNDTRYWPHEKAGLYQHLLISEGDIILAMDRPVVSAGLKLARALASDVPCLLVQRVARIRPKADLSWSFLFWAMQSSDFVRHLLKGQTGTQLPHINTKSISAYEMHLAPLTEQRRIVAKIEELFSDLDAGVAALKRAKANLKRYRAAVLKAAVEGKLTEEWRVAAASRRSPHRPTHTPEVNAPQHSQQDTQAHVGYFDPQQPLGNLQGNLPHWRQDHVTYFVTFRLADSIPAATMELWKRERDDWLSRNPEPNTPAQKRMYKQQFVERFHKWLDAGHGACHLARPEIRQIMINALLHYERERYLLREWVVMPNHVHVIVTPLPGHELSDILHTWKSFTAKAINKVLGTTGTLWQKESFDHIVRDPEQLERIERYIHDNPKSLPSDHFARGCLHNTSGQKGLLRDRHAPSAMRRADIDEFGNGEASTECADRGSDCATVQTGVDGRDATRQDAASTYEPASALLARILKERRQKWEADQLAKFAAAKKEPPKNWREKYVEPTPPDTTDLPELPEGWCWAKFDQLLTYLRNGFFQSPSGANSGTPILRINAVRPMKVDLAETRFLNEIEGNVDDYFIENGDLLFTRYNGSVDLLGVAGMVRSCTEKVLHPDKLIRVRLALGEPMPSFCEIAANVGASRRHMAGRARTTAGQTGISGPDVREMPIPLSPLDEQSQIVVEIAEKLSQIEAAETQIEHGLLRASRLRQSILKQAFEGKLVPQDPTDEPASVLLERLRSSRTGHEGNGKAATPNRTRGKITQISDEPRTRTRRRSSPQNQQEDGT